MSAKDKTVKMVRVFDDPAIATPVASSSQVIIRCVIPPEDNG